MEKIDHNIMEEKISEAVARRVLSIAPSKRRILDLNDKLLLDNYALIAHKASSLSSAQRKLVQVRVHYGVAQKRIKIEDVAEAVNEISKIIENELEEKIKKHDSSISE